MKKPVLLLILLFIIPSFLSASWTKGSFVLKKMNGRTIFIAPDGKPFYSKAMCYAWGPDTGPVKQLENNFAKARIELEFIKAQGFNTLNLYGLQELDSILTWCDQNEMAFYPRMNYYELSDFPQALRDYPDFMDPKFRKSAKDYFDKYCPIFKKHHSVLAIDMDQRWLFPLDWSTEKRVAEPMLGPAAVRYLPVWLEQKYKSIKDLNIAWEKQYSSFADVLKDTAIIENGAVKPLKKVPWRIDIFEYTLWTINDFLKELTAYIRSIDVPDRLITYTSEMSESCPFPLSTKENSGIDFVSPVYYNSKSDFGRDWTGYGALLARAKWHSDLQDIPCYISETGFRSSPLKQNPAMMTYGAGKPGDEDFVAELYLRQCALVNINPWMLGWTHFKLYDKLFEGDFGYIRDDRSLKPVSRLGQYINAQLPVNFQKEPEPKVWIYYPHSALSSPYASTMQLKSLVLLLEQDFLQDFDAMVRKDQNFIKNPAPAISKTPLFTTLLDTFQKKWVPFRFTATIPADDKPIIICGRALEQLSMKDRELLKDKKLIVLSQAGLEDERYHKTDKWFLSLLGIDGARQPSRFLRMDLKSYFNSDANQPGESAANEILALKSFPPVDTLIKCQLTNVFFQWPDFFPGKNNNIRCEGQELPVEQGTYHTLHLLGFAGGGDAAARITLVYSDGSRETAFIGKTVSDMHFQSFYYPDYHTDMAGQNTKGEKIYVSHYRITCNVTKVLKSVMFPSDRRLHFFAATLEENSDTAEKVDITVSAGKEKTQGLSYWVEPVDRALIKGKILAEFPGGTPAIAQSPDGRKTVFLYDAVTWKDAPDEISKDLEFHSRILKSILEPKK
jgi:hypothetical protein